MFDFNKVPYTCQRPPKQHYPCFQFLTEAKENSDICDRCLQTAELY